MSNARNIAALSTVEAGATADQTKADLNAIGVSGGRKNLIINGGMQVSQRGTYTSATTASDNSYYIDRWKDWSGIARTIQNTTVTLNNISNTKAVKYTATATSASSYMGTRQMVEGDFFPNGAVVTASCYMRTNNANARIRTYGVVSGGVTSSACPSDGAWHKVSLTQTSSIVGIPEVGVLVYDADETPTAIATGDYIEFSNVQLELGSVATDFEHRSYGDELALCQRYYASSYAHGVAAGTAYGGSCYKGEDPLMWGGSTVAWAAVDAVVRFPVTLRSSPQVNWYGVNTGNASKAGGTHCGSSTDDLTIYGTTVTTKYLTTYGGGGAYIAPTASNWSINWTADAEL